MTRYLSALFVVGFLVGCGNQGLEYPRGQQCVASYDPIPETYTGSGYVVSLNPAKQELQYGKYNYTGVDLVYRDSSQGIVIHIKEAYNPGQKKFVDSNVCVRGLLPQTKPFSANVKVLGGMEVTADGVKISTRDFGFSYADGRITRTVTVNAESTAENPMVLLQANSDQFDSYRIRPSDSGGRWSWMIRSQKALSPQVSVQLSVTMDIDQDPYAFSAVYKVGPNR